MLLCGAPRKNTGAKTPPLQNQITTESHERVRRLLRLLELEPIAGVRNLHPAYCSLLIKFDPLKLRHSELREILPNYIARMERVALPEPRLVEIPVCYGGGGGPYPKNRSCFHPPPHNQPTPLPT